MFNYSILPLSIIMHFKYVKKILPKVTSHNRKANDDE